MQLSNNNFMGIDIYFKGIWYKPYVSCSSSLLYQYRYFGERSQKRPLSSIRDYLESKTTKFIPFPVKALGFADSLSIVKSFTYEWLDFRTTSFCGNDFRRVLYARSRMTFFGTPGKLLCFNLIVYGGYSLGNGHSMV